MSELASEPMRPSQFRIDIDRTRCMGSGNCSFWAPDTFDLDDEGFAVVVNPDGDDASKIQNAANGCPTQAITLTERA